MTTYPLLAALAAAAATAAVLAWVLIGQRKAWRAGMEAMVQRRGWRFAQEQATGGRPARLLLEPAGGSAWALVAQRQGHESGGDTGMTEFRSPLPPAPGLTLVGPPLPPAEAALAAGLLSMLGGPFGQKALAAMIGAERAALAGRLAPQDGFGTATVLAEHAPKDPGALADAISLLAGWVPRRSGEAGRPVLIREPDAMVLRLRHDLRKPDDLEAFADLGLALAATLGR